MEETAASTYSPSAFSAALSAPDTSRTHALTQLLALVRAGAGRFSLVADDLVQLVSSPLARSPTKGGIPAVATEMAKALEAGLQEHVLRLGQLETLIGSQTKCDRSKKLQSSLLVRMGSHTKFDSDLARENAELRLRVKELEKELRRAEVAAEKARGDAKIAEEKTRIEGRLTGMSIQRFINLEQQERGSVAGLMRLAKELCGETGSGGSRPRRRNKSALLAQRDTIRVEGLSSCKSLLVSARAGESSERVATLKKEISHLRSENRDLKSRSTVCFGKAGSSPQITKEKWLATQLNFAETMSKFASETEWRLGLIRDRVELAVFNLGSVRASSAGQAKAEELKCELARMQEEAMQNELLVLRLRTQLKTQEAECMEAKHNAAALSGRSRVPDSRLKARENWMRKFGELEERLGSIGGMVSVLGVKHKEWWKDLRELRCEAQMQAERVQGLSAELESRRSAADDVQSDLELVRNENAKKDLEIQHLQQWKQNTCARIRQMYAPGPSFPGALHSRLDQLSSRCVALSSLVCNHLSMRHGRTIKRSDLIRLRSGLLQMVQRFETRLDASLQCLQIPSITIVRSDTSAPAQNALELSLIRQQQSSECARIIMQDASEGFYQSLAAHTQYLEEKISSVSDIVQTLSQRVRFCLNVRTNAKTKRNSSLAKEIARLKECFLTDSLETMHVMSGFQAAMRAGHDLIMSKIRRPSSPKGDEQKQVMEHERCKRLYNEHFKQAFIRCAQCIPIGAIKEVDDTLMPLCSMLGMNKHEIQDLNEVRRFGPKDKAVQGKKRSGIFSLFG